MKTLNVTVSVCHTKDIDIKVPNKYTEEDLQRATRKALHDMGKFMDDNNFMEYEWDIEVN